MQNVSDRQRDAFDNPAKAACRAGNLRVPREAAKSAFFARGSATIEGSLSAGRDNSAHAT